MRLIAHLVVKDLKRKARSPLPFVAALLLPVIFAGMIALAFGRGNEVPKVALLVANQDGGLLGNAIASAFASPRAAAYFDVRAVDEATGRELMESGGASALLTIPAGFTRDVLDGKPVVLRLMRNPSQGILPEIAEQSAGALADLLEGSRRLLAEPLARLRPFLTDDADAGPADADVIAIALAATQSVRETSGLIFPPAIALDSELFGGAKTGTATKQGGTTSAIFLLVLPGVAVYALFLVADQGMRDVMTERTLGTLRRQLAGPVTVETLVVAKAAYTGLLAAVAIVVLAIVGWAALREPVSLAGFALVSAALVLAVAGTTSIVYGFAKTERAAATLGSALFLAMGFLGGGFFRIESLPHAVRGFAPLTPLYWGTQGYRALLEHGAGVAEVLRHAGILAGMGVALLAIGMAGLRRTARAASTA